MYNNNRSSIRGKLPFLIYLTATLLVSLAIVYVFSLKNWEGLHVVIKSDAQYFQLFYNSGQGFNQKESVNSASKFILPDKKIDQIRIDPFTTSANIQLSISSISFYNAKRLIKVVKGEELLSFLLPLAHIAQFEFDKSLNKVVFMIDGKDPSFILSFPNGVLAKETKPQTLIEKIGIKHICIFALLFGFFLAIWFSLKYLKRFLTILNRFIDGSLNDQELKTTFSTRQSMFYKVISPFIPLKFYWVAFFIFSLIYIFMYTQSNMIVFTFAGHDDALLYNQAQSICGLNWLGKYSSLILAKEPGYAFFLAFCMITGIPYLLLVSICNIIAVSFFMKSSLWLFEKTKVISLLLGITLLFNPFLANELRTYRNQLTAICFLVFIGVIVAMYNPVTKRESGITKLVQATIAFLGFGFLFHTREETILYNAIMALSVVTFLLVIKNIRYHRRNLYLMASGIFGIVVFGTSISLMNYAYYGAFTTCERTSPPFSSAIHAFQSVDDPWLDPRLPKSTSSEEKIETIANVIPEFRKQASILTDSTNKSFKDCGVYFDRDELKFKRTNKDEIPSSHFEWFWIHSVDKAGYYKSGKQAANYYKTLNIKIREALKNGSLKKREVFITSGPYLIDKGDLLTICKILPGNYSLLLPKPETFRTLNSNFATRIIPQSLNSNDLLKQWQKAIKIRCLYPDDIESQQKAKNSFYNLFWNWWISIFAYLFIPIMHLTTPLALLFLIISLIKKRWNSAAVILIITSSYLANFLLLAIIDVSVGFNATNRYYYLPAYSFIIINSFLVINFLIVSLFRRKNKLILSLEQNQTY